MLVATLPELMTDNNPVKSAFFFRKSPKIFPARRRPSWPRVNRKPDNCFLKIGEKPLTTPYHSLSGYLFPPLHIISSYSSIFLSSPSPCLSLKNLLSLRKPRSMTSSFSSLPVPFNGCKMPPSLVWLQNSGERIERAPHFCLAYVRVGPSFE